MQLCNFTWGVDTTFEMFEFLYFQSIYKIACIDCMFIFSSCPSLLYVFHDLRRKHAEKYYPVVDGQFIPMLGNVQHVAVDRLWYGQKIIVFNYNYLFIIYL